MHIKPGFVRSGKGQLGGCGLRFLICWARVLRCAVCQVSVVRALGHTHRFRMGHALYGIGNSPALYADLRYQLPAVKPQFKFGEGALHRLWPTKR